MSIARGILKGFIGQAVDTKVAEDKRLADLTDRISETYLNTTLPNFLEKEMIIGYLFKNNHSYQLREIACYPNFRIYEKYSQTMANALSLFFFIAN